MITLEELKNLTFNIFHKEDKTNLEFEIMYWIENKEFFGNHLNEDEIMYGLAHYLDQDTENFWKKFLTPQTINMYLNLLDNSSIINIFNKMKEEIPENLSGILNILNQQIIFSDSFWGKIIKTFNPYQSYDVGEIDLLKDLTQSEVNYPIMINYSAELNTLSFVIKNSMINFPHIEEYFLSSMDIIKNTAIISLVITSLYSVNGHAQDSDVKNALLKSAQALEETAPIKSTMKTIQNKGSNDVKKFQESNPDASIPLAILGYGVKSIKEKGVSINSKSSLFEQEIGYKMVLGKELKVNIDTNNPFIDKSKVSIGGTKSKVEANVVFDINW